MKYAIVYASVYGQTRAICEFIKNRIIQTDDQQNSVELVEISRANFNSAIIIDSDVIILGAPIYAGRFSKSLMKWVQANKNQLRNKKLAMFTVSLNAANIGDRARRVDNQMLRKFINTIGLIPNYVASFVGALNYREYGWLKRIVMKRISTAAGGPTDTTRDYELTNWKAVDSFANDLIQESKSSEYLMTKRFFQDEKLNQTIPEFEQSCWSEAILHQSPSEIFGQLITKPVGKYGADSLFSEAPQEIIAGFIGKPWKLNLDVLHLKPDDFKNFNEPGYVKVVSHYWIYRIGATDYSKVNTEMRFHATSLDAAKKMKRYWKIARPVIQLYMKIMLRSLGRNSEMKNQNIIPGRQALR